MARTWCINQLNKLGTQLSIIFYSKKKIYKTTKQKT